MGKALVLKNVDFSTNKLDTVTIYEPIPCSAITLNKSTINFTSLGTDTLTATVTPSNTTDTVVWSTSDSGVATVNNGVVTAVGLGTATITATCGGKTDTCTVSVSVIITETSMAKMLHRYNSGTNLSAGKDYLGCYGEESGNYLKCCAFLSSVETPSGYKALSGDVALYNGKYPFIIPLNAEYIEVTSSGFTLDTMYYSWLDSTSQTTYSTSGKGCKALSDVLTSNNVVNNKIKLTIPTNIEDLDSIVFGLKFTAAVSDGDTTGVTITFT